ncbi:MAG: alpha/beta hydrolase, partial [Actinomycetia bacterium]|nr:alpha/beta hydrolase [Actinomycetes bacterium]
LAQYLVAAGGDLITAAVFANTFPPNSVIAKRSKNLVSLAKMLPPSFIKAFLARNVERALVPAGDGSALLGRLLMEQYDQARFKELFLDRFQCAIEPFDTVPPAMPVLLISADNDPLVPQELAEDLWATYPDASTYEFDGGGHFPYVNRPSEYTAILDRFLP